MIGVYREQASTIAGMDANLADVSQRAEAAELQLAEARMAHAGRMWREAIMGRDR
jgi:hypothetical protein